MKPENILDLFCKNFDLIENHIMHVRDVVNQYIYPAIHGNFSELTSKGALFVAHSGGYTANTIPYSWLCADESSLLLLLQKEKERLEDRKKEETRIREVERLGALAAKEHAEKSQYLILKEKYEKTLV